MLLSGTTNLLRLSDPNDPSDEAGSLEAIDRRTSRLSARLPVAIVFSEHAVGALRAFLSSRGLNDYRIFHCTQLDLHDAERNLEALGETAEWEVPTALLPGGEPLVALTYTDTSATLWDPGFLHLARHEVVIARWYWLDRKGALQCLWLAAARTAEHYLRLRQEILRLRHERGQGVWQVVHGGYDSEPIPRNQCAGEELVLAAAVRQRVESEILRFFTPEVAAMYADMKVPYRRGVLLHGPPGNGKTSLIRYIGTKLPEIPCLLLRPACGFDTDDLETVITRWKSQAPAVLVIEDLDWLLGVVDVSRFLNLLDGVETKATGGLLLIATTNHPNKLDPAVNNRPGRFDVVLEVPCPEESLRREYFARNLDNVDAAILGHLTTMTNRLSFAHLQELVRLAGLMAIHAGHTHRTGDDLMQAAKAVCASHEDAMRGFAHKLEVPFGLGHLIAAKRSPAARSGE